MNSLLIFGYINKMKSSFFGVLFPNKQQIILTFISMLFFATSYAQQFETTTIKANFIVKEINRTGKLTFRKTEFL